MQCSNLTLPKCWKTVNLDFSNQENFVDSCKRKDGKLFKFTKSGCIFDKNRLIFNYLAQQNLTNDYHVQPGRQIHLRADRRLPDVFSTKPPQKNTPDGVPSGVFQLVLQPRVQRELFAERDHLVAHGVRAQLLRGLRGI